MYTYTHSCTGTHRNKQRVTNLYTDTHTQTHTHSHRHNPSLSSIWAACSIIYIPITRNFDFDPHLELFITTGGQHSIPPVVLHIPWERSMKPFKQGDLSPMHLKYFASFDLNLGVRPNTAGFVDELKASHTVHGWAQWFTDWIMESLICSSRDVLTCDFDQMIVLPRESRPTISEDQTSCVKMSLSTVAVKSDQWPAHTQTWVKHSRRHFEWGTEGSNWRGHSKYHPSVPPSKLSLHNFFFLNERKRCSFFFSQSYTFTSNQITNV